MSLIRDLVQRLAAAGDVTVHYCATRPANNSDLTGVLCIRAGDATAVKVERAQPAHAWTLDKAHVTCKRCLEWMHA